MQPRERGTLVVPPSAERFRAEPAIPMIVKRGAKLYKSPIASENKEDSEELVSYTFTQSNGIEILAIPPESKAKGTTRVRVAEVKLEWKDEQGRPENRTPKVKEIIRYGFMDAKDLILHPKCQCTYKKFKPDIFERDPMREDIVQSYFANCFLLSALGEIASTDAGRAFLRSIMRQGEDITTVKLFNPITNKFEWIEVENTELYINGENVVYHKQPWVHVIEKAYAVMASKSGKLTAGERGLFPSFLSIFTGDDPGHAMLILTGKPAETKAIKKEIVHPFFKLSYETRERLEKKSEKKGDKSSSSKPAGLLYEIFKSDEMIERWLKIAAKEKDALIAIPATYSLIEDNSVNEKFISFVEKLEDREVAFWLQNFIEQEFPRKYHRSLKKIYDDFNNALDDEKLIAISSMKELKEDKTKDGKKIVPNHAYMVTHVRESIEPHEYYITLRNPWGNQSSGMSAEFEISLTDFVRFFSHYNIGEFSNVPVLKIIATSKDLPKLPEVVNNAFQQIGILDEKMVSADKKLFKQFIEQLDIKLDSLKTYLQRCSGLISVHKAEKNIQDLYEKVSAAIASAEKNYDQVKKLVNNDFANADQICKSYVKSLEELAKSAQALNEAINNLPALPSKLITHEFEITAEGLENQNLSLAIAQITLQAKDIDEDKKRDQSEDLAVSALVSSIQTNMDFAQQKSNLKPLYTESNDIKSVFEECRGMKGLSEDDLTFLISTKDKECVFFAKKIGNQTYFYVIELNESKTKISGKIHAFDHLPAALEKIQALCGEKTELSIYTTPEKYLESLDYIPLHNLLKELNAFVEEGGALSFDDSHRLLCNIIYHLKNIKRELREEDKKDLIQKYLLVINPYFSVLDQQIKKANALLNKGSLYFVKRLKQIQQLNSELLKKLKSLPKTEEYYALFQFENELVQRNHQILEYIASADKSKEKKGEAVAEPVPPSIKHDKEKKKEPDKKKEQEEKKENNEGCVAHLSVINSSEKIRDALVAYLNQDKYRNNPHILDLIEKLEDPELAMRQQQKPLKEWSTYRYLVFAKHVVKQTIRKDQSLTDLYHQLEAITTSPEYQRIMIATLVNQLQKVLEDYKHITDSRTKGGNLFRNKKQTEMRQMVLENMNKYLMAQLIKNPSMTAKQFHQLVAEEVTETIRVLDADHENQSQRPRCVQFFLPTESQASRLLKKLKEKSHLKVQNSREQKENSHEDKNAPPDLRENYLAKLRNFKKEYYRKFACKEISNSQFREDMDARYALEQLIQYLNQKDEPCTENDIYVKWVGFSQESANNHFRQSVTALVLELEPPLPPQRQQRSASC